MAENRKSWMRVRRSDLLGWVVDSPTSLPLATGSAGTWVSILCLTGSLIGLAITLALPDPFQYHLNLALNATFLTISALLLLRSDRIGRRGVNFIVAVATVVVSVQIATGGGTDPAVMAVVFYAWVALFVFAFLSTFEALAQIAFVVICYSLALIYGERPSAPLADWILTTSTVIVASISTGFLNYQIRRVALTDSLTGIANRKGWDLSLDREMARARRQGHYVLVAIVDLNDFKQINDLYGHSVGDRVLVETARELQEALRPFDVVARWGGDEFVVLALLDQPDSAFGLMDRIVHQVGKDTPLSCGAVVASPDDGTGALLLARADQVLYKAKDDPEGGYKLETFETLRP